MKDSNFLIEHTELFRVSYSESDRMGYCYYGNYARFMEVARVEALRSVGLVYRELEDQGFLLPVSKMELKYIRPIKYDDQFQVTVGLREGAGLKLDFDYEFKDLEGNTLAVGYTQLVFVDPSGRPTRPSADILTKFQMTA